MTEQASPDGRGRHSRAGRKIVTKGIQSVLKINDRPKVKNHENQIFAIRLALERRDVFLEFLTFSSKHTTGPIFHVFIVLRKV